MPDPPMTHTHGTLLDLGYHGDLGALRAAAREVDRIGSSALFVSEAAHDALVPLASITHDTTMPIGTSVAIAFGRTPMALAYGAHDLQRLSGGRLLLGLGTQIAPHITRRFAMPWSKPAERMREYVGALRAIWQAWEEGSRLSFQGDFYEHTLMPEAFSPGPLEMAPPPIWLAAVGPRMLEVAAEVADGLIVHPLTSTSYLREVIDPGLGAARAAAGRTGPFTRSAMALVATGRTEEELGASIVTTRRQIAFYASTPAYLPVLAHHGWDDLHKAARTGMREGGYADLGALVDDSVLNAFAVVGEPSQVASELVSRYAGVDRVTLTLPYQEVGVGSAALQVLAHAARRVPA